jgi:tetratricopeptide (TPR) repeat protein
MSRTSSTRPYLFAFVFVAALAAQETKPATSEAFDDADRRLSVAYDAASAGKPGIFVRAAFADAAEAYRALATAAETSKDDRRRAWFGVGDAAAGGGDMEAALRAYGEAAKLGAPFEADLRAARALLDSGDRKACLERLSAPLQSDDPTVRSDAVLLSLEARLDDGDRAAVTEIFVAVVPTLSFEGRAACWDLAASRLRAIGGDGYWRGLIDDALRRDPKDARALFWLGDAALVSKAHPRATRAFRAYRRERPDAFDGKFWTAVAEGRAGLLDAAVASVRDAAVTEPYPGAAAPALREIAALLYGAKRYEDAATLQGLAAEGSGLFSDALDFGALLNDAGRALDAIGAYERLLARPEVAGPDRARALNFLGLALRGVGDDAAAEKRFAEALEAWDDERDARENLGVLLIETGRAELSKPYLERCVARETDRRRARFHLFRLRYPQVDGPAPR